MRSRSERRHHYQRRKIAVKTLRKALGWNIDLDQRAIGKYANTRHPCSCYMCGNPRKNFGEITVQEKKHTLA